MGAERLQGDIMEVAYRCFLDRAVHPLDLPVSPRMERPRQTVLNAVSMTYHVEPVRLIGFSSWALGELRAVICQYGMNPIRQLLKGIFEELRRLFPLSLAIEAGMYELGGSINGHE